VEGLSTATTAECLGVSEEVVKTRLSRARLKLRDGLYERAGVVASAAFTFGAERCDRVVAGWSAGTRADASSQGPSLQGTSTILPWCPLLSMTASWARGAWPSGSSLSMIGRKLPLRRPSTRAEWMPASCAGEA
jgi:Sigma-70, region 4